MCVLYSKRSIEATSFQGLVHPDLLNLKDSILVRNS